MGREVAGGDVQPLAGHDEDEHAAVDEVARRLHQEGVLRALLLVVVVIRRVEVEQAERPVGDGGLEEVGGQRPVQALPGLGGAVAVQLHAVRLDGHRVRLRQPLGELRNRFARAAARVEDAERLPAAPAAGAVGHGSVDQPRDQVDDAGRCRVEPALRLSCKSHGVPPVVCVDGSGAGRVRTQTDCAFRSRVSVPVSGSIHA